MHALSASATVADIVKAYPTTRRVFDRYGLQGCGGAEGPSESLEFFARVHQIDLNKLLEELQAEVEAPATGHYAARETLADSIYRRFFKAGIAVVLTVGALWGAINLMQIALAKNFLQLRLVPAIHAHAHAMIFGWVGLFVMGFAYQAFPRFKYVSLWQPKLAVFTLYLMLAGIGARIAAELLQPALSGLLLGVVSAVAELTAIALFVLILVRTARKSAEPHAAHEKFIFGALFWFFVQALLSSAFFFAKATAAGREELVRRIALMDGPLRDIQLLGFAALMIAGVSQRFIPAVYGLEPSRRDWRNAIFWLMNFSLVADVVSYVLMVATRRRVFAAGLELAYALTVIWAILLVLQLGVFRPPAERDRSWKFIRGAYVWLLVSALMLPFSPLYSLLTHQHFAHSYMGAQRHAFTVGFVTMMIMGVAARVVPILAGVDSKILGSLTAPFFLLNAGNVGRVVCQILTDFFPVFAYPLVGVTGLLEVTALAWWGTELWKTMNHRRALRSQPLIAHAP